MRPPTALTIAGSDSSGGAGIQADLKTFTALGVYGASALTALTAQNTQGVQRVIPVTPDDVVAQLTSVLDDVAIDATKIGMLGGAEVVAAVADLIARRRQDLGTLVVDPVLVATSGDVLTSDDAALTLRDELLPLADILTPNLPEAARLLGTEPAGDLEQLAEQGRALHALGVPVVVMKGGHLDPGAEHDDDGAPRHGSVEVTDLVVHRGGVEVFSSPRVRTRNTHGTGCTLSSAIAAEAARACYQGGRLGVPEWIDAVSAGRDYLHRALTGATDWQLSRAPDTGHGPVNHLLGRDVSRD
ncbi:MAG: bifunctional hydroxymethylpyrimidine kinase/phosphomethylpyrimidine kinase [Micrococcaceae bacterium]